MEDMNPQVPVQMEEPKDASITPDTEPIKVVTSTREDNTQPIVVRLITLYTYSVWASDTVWLGAIQPIAIGKTMPTGNGHGRVMAGLI